MYVIIGAISTAVSLKNEMIANIYHTSMTLCRADVSEGYFGNTKSKAEKNVAWNWKAARSTAQDSPMLDSGKGKAT